jgi:transposase
MSTPRAHPVRLTAAQRHRLKKIAPGHKSPHRDRLRAQIVLDAAAGHAGTAIARRCRVTSDTARKWRGRFATDAFDGLRDRKRCRRPPRFTPVQQAQVKALACELPAASAVPLSRWSAAEVAHQAVIAGLVDAISGATVRRWLRADALKPWQYRSWIPPRAPDFAARAAVALDPYAGSYDGEPLGQGDFVLCADEKTSIQARCRCHPTLAATLGHTQRRALSDNSGQSRSATDQSRRALSWVDASSLTCPRQRAVYGMQAVGDRNRLKPQGATAPGNPRDPSPLRPHPDAARICRL